MDKENTTQTFFIPFSPFIFLLSIFSSTNKNNTKQNKDSLENVLFAIAINKQKMLLPSVPNKVSVSVAQKSTFSFSHPHSGPEIVTCFVVFFFPFSFYSFLLFDVSATTQNTNSGSVIFLGTTTALTNKSLLYFFTALFSKILWLALSFFLFTISLSLLIKLTRQANFLNNFLSELTLLTKFQDIKNKNKNYTKIISTEKFRKILEWNSIVLYLHPNKTCSLLYFLNSKIDSFQ